MEREPRGVHQTRGTTGGGGAAGAAGSRSSSHAEPDFLLQWGSRKRLRCVKIQVKAAGAGSERRGTTVRVDRRVVRSAADKESPSSAQLARRPSPGHRILRNSDGSAAASSAAMRSPQRHIANGHEDRGTTRSMGAGGRNGGSNGFLDELAHLHHLHHHHHNTTTGSNSINKKGSSAAIGCGLSSSGNEMRAFVWPKFEIALSNKEKEEDFFVFKGCTKLPQRPKKRAKCIQKTLNLVCPGTWLSDLTQERYEVREKKVSKKRPRGLKAMGSMDSDSE